MEHTLLRIRLIAAATLLTAMLLGACGGESITVYSGRNEALIAPILERFTEDTGIEVSVKYGSTSELAATLLEEGSRTRADVFIAQDAGALGVVEAAGLFAPLTDDVLGRVAARYRSPDGRWVALSGRARVVVYNTERLSPADLPASIMDFTDPRWRGRLAWAPTNGSFQSFVTALRVAKGEDAAREWLLGIRANGVVDYPNNTSIVEAVGAGEVDLGFVNHYYLYGFLRERGEGFPARNYFTAPGDIGTLVNVAGIGMLAASDQQELAQRLIDYLLSADAQRYFAEQTFEYPVIDSVPAAEDLPPLATIQPPALDLGLLGDLDGTLKLLRETGVLP